MSRSARVVIVGGLVVLVGLVLALKEKGRSSGESEGLETSAPAESALPRLVDIGSDKCIPCMRMAPILKELKSEYAGRLEVVFIDIREDADAIAEYGIQLIPTQIFYDAEGKERSRHEGFLSKEDILATWRQIGVRLEPRSKGPASPEPASAGPDER